MIEVRKHMNQEDLKRLILDAKNGNSKAFEEIYSELYTPLFQYVYKRLKNKQDTEDIIQMVFIKIWNSINSWKPAHTSPLAFFFTVARTSIIDHFRKKSSKDLVSDEIVQEHIESYDKTMDSVYINDDVEKLKKALNELSEEQREIIELYYMNEFSYKEISKIIEKREDAIRQTHSRAIKKLREIYK